MSRAKVTAVALAACVTLAGAGLPWGHATREASQPARDQVAALESLASVDGAARLADLEATTPPLNLAASTRALDAAANSAGLVLEYTGTQVSDLGADAREVTWTVGLDAPDGTPAARPAAAFIAALDPATWAVQDVHADEAHADVVLTTRHRR